MRKAVFAQTSKSTALFAVVSLLGCLSGAVLLSAPLASAHAASAPVHRFYCDWGMHFFTISDTEKATIMNNLPCAYEGVGWVAQQVQEADTSPVHRFYCAWGGHFFTISPSEADYVRDNLPCTYEGVGWYAYPFEGPDTLPVHRFYCAWGGHFFTMSPSEADYVRDNLPCSYEGVGWYAKRHQSVVKGFNFSPYIHEFEDPGNGGRQITDSELYSRLKVVAPWTRWVRTFGCNQDLHKAGLFAHSMGLKTAIQAWISSDVQENQRQISCLVEQARNGHVDLAIIGSEVLLRQDLSPQELIDLIRSVKSQIGNIAVSYADTHLIALTYPEIFNEVDVVSINSYPYWEGTPIDQAVGSVEEWYYKVVSAANGKPVVISETGWPSGGSNFGLAVPSLENANAYFRDFVRWANSRDILYFYFEAFDEIWKAQHEGPEGAHWGVWEKDLRLKDGMGPAFREPEIPGGPGTPTIEFTYPPPIGSNDDLVGRVLHVVPSNFRIAVYINVNGRWWTKPYYNNNVTLISGDGTWTTDITTGGQDTSATTITAFLIPRAYSPPAIGNSPTLPGELWENAAAWEEVTRAR